MNVTKTIPIVMVGAGFDPVEAGYVESLAHPGGNVTGITNLTPELGGKRLELLKDAVPKLARVAILYDPTSPGPLREVKEELPVAARALKLTIQPWEIRDANGLERVFAALNKERPNGFYATSGGLMGANRKRIADFALKSRLPSVGGREYVDAGGLMYYGAGEMRFWSRFKLGSARFVSSRNQRLRKSKSREISPTVGIICKLKITPLPGGSPMRRSGYTLTILRKEPDGRWGIFRDAADRSRRKWRA